MGEFKEGTGKHHYIQSVGQRDVKQGSEIYMLALLITILAAVITIAIFILAQHKDEIWEEYINRLE